MIDYKKTYEDAFKVPGYNDDPGADKYQFVLKTLESHLEPGHKYDDVVDIGCGKGYMLQHLHVVYPQLTLWGLDVDNFLNPDINKYVTIIKMDITGNRNELIAHPDYGWTQTFDVATCLDVLEHIEKDKLDSLVKWISTLAPIAYISVGNHRDIINGVELHPTREKLPYWQGLLEQYFEIVRIEDREDIWYSFELKSKEYL